MTQRCPLAVVLGALPVAAELLYRSQAIDEVPPARQLVVAGTGRTQRTAQMIVQVFPEIGINTIVCPIRGLTLF